MATVLRRGDSVEKILDSGEFEALIGTPESEWLEFKGEIYDLRSEKYCHELAKDVAAMANAGGGLIVLGVATRRDDEHHPEVADAVRIFNLRLANTEQYMAIINARIYPRLTATAVQWKRSLQDAERGLVLISVPDAGEDRPVLVQKIPGENNKVMQVIVACYERRRADTTHYSIQELHAMIKDGRRFAEIDQRLRELSDATHRLDRSLTGNTESEAPAISDGEMRRRIENLLRVVDLEGKPSLVLAARPDTAVQIDSLTLSNSGAVALLLNPPTLRPGGFDLGLYREAPLWQIGRVRRAVNVDDSGLELSRDGSLAFAVSGDADFLCRSTRPGKNRPLRISPLVITEVTYLFCVAYQQALGLMNPRPSKSKFNLEVRNLGDHDDPPELIPERVRDGPSFAEPFVAPYGSESFSCLISSDTPPEVAGFCLLKELYLWFGIPEDRIPYTGGRDGGGQQIVLDQIVRH